MIPDSLSRLLPDTVCKEADRLSGGGQLEEIRIRAGSPLSVVVTGREEKSGTLLLSRTEMEELLLRLCGGSLHSYMDTLADGYLPLPDGARCGVVGSAVGDRNGVHAIRGVTSLNLRIPHCLSGVSDPCLRYLAAHSFGEGMLLFSPPGVGKTTVLRDLAASLAKSPYRRRVAVIDTRGELWVDSLFAGSLADRLDGYPRGIGMEIATRTLSPHLIVCDEIGSGEADAVLTAQNAGVPLIATAHARDTEDLFRRKELRMLCEHRVFGVLAGLSRAGNRMTIRFFDPVAGNELTSTPHNSRLTP